MPSQIQPLQRDAGLGAREERTELYVLYCEGALERATTSSARNARSVSARQRNQQPGVVRRLA